MRGERRFDMDRIAKEQEMTMSTSGNPGEHREKKTEEMEYLFWELYVTVWGRRSGGKVE